MMRFRRSCFSVLIFCFSVSLWLGPMRVSSSLVRWQAQTLPTSSSREEAFRANNIGVALLEQFKHKEGSDSFKRAVQLDPKLALARINLSIALYNVPDYPAAQREAQAASVLAPNALQPYYILGLIAKTQSRFDEAVAAFQRVLKTDSNDVGANVNLGQIYSQQRKYPEAIAVFRTALAAEPYNATALYNLGTALIRTGQREEGQRVIQRFQEFRNRGSGSTLGNNYLEQGRYAEAVASTGGEPELIDRATPVVSFKDATTGFFAGSASIAKLPAVDIRSSSLFGKRFKSGPVDETAKRDIATSIGSGITLFDFDGDGDFDLFGTKDSEQHLFRNDSGKFTDITDQAGALKGKVSGIAVGTVAGDYDNDGKPDLFVTRDSEVALYHNDGGGKFSDVTQAAGIPGYPYLPSSVAFVDVDHDGDLDIFITGLADLSKAVTGDAGFPNDFGVATNLLLRNAGNGKFTDITAAAKLDRPGHAVAVVPTDFNNRRDIDLLVVNYGKAPDLYSNQRDGTFRNVAAEVGLVVEAHWTCVAAGDFNKDGYTDFFFGKADGPGLLATSDGKEKFKTTDLIGTENAQAAQFLDYDNDGLLDCVLLSDKGLRVFRNVGDGWIDVSEKAAADWDSAHLNSGRLFASGDLDGDGDKDLVVLSPDGQLRIVRNDGGHANHSLRVNLEGKVSNRSGVGAKIEARAGSLIQKLETYSASPAPAPVDLVFGLGKRASVDCVRVLWPAGIVQAETEIMRQSPTKSSVVTLAIHELDRKPSSCPYLYAWNGEQFKFITDFMGGGEMGYLEEPGRHNTPDPDEYVRIRGDQLKERNGYYELRVTNELEEALFADQFQLIAVDHPREVEVYPNEGMSEPPRAFTLYATRAARPPLTAIDDHGNDVLPLISSLDRRYPADFKLDHIRGYAAEHTLTMDLRDQATNRQGSPDESADKSAHSKELRHSAGSGVLLLLTGWTDYAWSSDNLAASQSGKGMSPPSLQVKDTQGKWRTVIKDIGIPVGRPQTVTVDLSRKFLSNSREVRIVTNMRIYWDQILVTTSLDRNPKRITRLNPLEAVLHWRGFSREITPDGREPFGYDYQEVSFTSPWKTMPGHYTREGDVRELLLKSDDMFVVSRPGDEIRLSFSSQTLPRLSRGWTRTFLFYADGFSKEMDINSASPDQVLPLPFHGMTKYPYKFPEAYPLTEVRRKYIEKYNTRYVSAEVPPIDSMLAR